MVREPPPATSVMRLKIRLLLPLLALPFAASAQNVPLNCPELPAGIADANWEEIRGDDFLYCKAIRDNGAQALGVMLREKPQFKERSRLREDKAVIDGHKVRWYRGDITSSSGELVRETLVELHDDVSAHIVVRASTEEKLEERLRLAEALHFPDFVATRD